jgi:type IV pilus assembly protein PilC
MVCQMIAVGETTGALDAMLQKIADFYEDEVDNTVANLMSLMEPAVMVFLGVVIGGLVVSMYLPIFQLGSVLNCRYCSITCSYCNAPNPPRPSSLPS